MMFAFTLPLILPFLHLTGCHRPSEQQPTRPLKLDIGFILDGSKYGKGDLVDKAVELMKEFGNHLSVSSGTTRFAFLTINDTKVQKHFLFEDIVNRECLITQLRKITDLNIRSISAVVSGRENISGRKTFRRSLRRAIDMLKGSSHQISDQRVIYFLVSNSLSRLKMAKSKGFGEPYEILPILAGSQDETYSRNGSFKLFEYDNRRDFKSISKALELEDKDYSSCTNEGSTQDECNRACTCNNGTLQKCFRIRKEFTEMTLQEQKRFLETYKHLTTTWPYKERYEEFVFMHFRYFCLGVHWKSLFLPWHRWYLSQMEDLLRQIDCRVTIPYWDWSIVSDNAWNNSKIWSKDGLGGDGDEKRGFCVQDGMFGESKWRTPYWEDPLKIIAKTSVAYIGNHNGTNITDVGAHLTFCLRRSMNGKPPGVKSIRNILKIPPRRFNDFNLHMIQNYHNTLHQLFGGTMWTDFAADAPEFWLLHGFLDKIWHMWQSKSHDHKYVHFLQLNTTKMIGCNYTRRDYIDSHSLPRCTRIKYSNFPNSVHGIDMRQKRSIKHGTRMKLQNHNATGVPDNGDIDERLNDEDTEEPYMNKELRIEPIDDMGRTSNSFWESYLQKKYELGNQFPKCNFSRRDGEKAFQLYREIDL